MVSSSDVARRAGVSQSAVSRVFTPGASVSAQMRERVLEAAAALGYRPNALARSLITGKSRVIGLVVAYLDNQYYPVVLERLCATLQARGFHVMLFLAPDATASADRMLEEILDHQVAGLVMASATLASPLARRCSERGVPVVQFNRVQDDPAVDAVTSDNEAGGRTLAKFLLAGGHQRIAYLAGWEGASTQRDREAGFRAGLAAAGVRLFARGVGNYDADEARVATIRLFRRKERPDAIFVANDHMALPAMDALRFELGLRIPEDVSVVSYDDTPPASWPSYALTGIRQPTGAMVARIVGMLEARIAGDQSPAIRAVLPGDLIIRRSARLPSTASEPLTPFTRA